MHHRGTVFGQSRPRQEKESSFRHFVFCEDGPGERVINDYLLHPLKMMFHLMKPFSEMIGGGGNVLHVAV